MCLHLINVETAILTQSNWRDFANSSRHSDDVRDFARLLKDVAMVDFPSTTIDTVDYYRNWRDGDRPATDTGLTPMRGDVHCYGSRGLPDTPPPFSDFLHNCEKDFNPFAEDFMVLRSWRGGVLTVLYFQKGK